ncbi:MAG: hypothetical protein ACO1OB_33540 [Archangium sp.]
MTTEEREFVCAACGHRARASVVGMGEGAASFLNSEGTGDARAKKDALQDVDATIAVAPCPKCGVRNVGAVVKWWLRSAVAPTVLTLLVLTVLTFAPTWFKLGIEPEEQLTLAYTMGAVSLCTLILVIPLPVWMKWKSTKDRVHWK